MNSDVQDSNSVYFACPFNLAATGKSPFFSKWDIERDWSVSMCFLTTWFYCFVQDCWRPYYKEDYNAFYNVIKSKYPGLILISNCDLGTGSRTELYDWHTYDDSQTMWVLDLSSTTSNYISSTDSSHSSWMHGLQFKKKSRRPIHVEFALGDFEVDWTFFRVKHLYYLRSPLSLS